jgi:alpha-ketoglutarate-dependent taurine dioxygenase
MISPSVPDVDLIRWAEMAKAELQRILSSSGAILFRGFGITPESDLERFIQVVSGQPLAYVERSSPRSQVAGNIYTSTEHPADQPIFLHCENSYQKTWPLKIFFCCHTRPEHGGETPIADTRRILKRLRPEIREAFENKGVMYVRNFGPGLGLSWQTVFQTGDRARVEQYCAEMGIECAWKGAERLTTRHVRAAIRTHPVTGEQVWFNHAAFFHITTLDAETQKNLRQLLGQDELPNNTYYGDGTEIEPEVAEHLRACYAAETVMFTWQSGDLLMLDNMLAAHGRSSYRGPRRILVGMAEPCSN